MDWAELALTLTPIILLFMMRRVVLWYFQIDRRTKALEAIEESLNYLPAVQQGKAAKLQRNRRVA
jgi:hypothetical protein